MKSQVDYSTHQTNKNKFLNFLEYLLGFFLILEGNSVYRVMKDPLPLPWICYFLTVVLFVYLLFVKRKPDFSLFLLTAIYMAIFAVVQLPNRGYIYLVQFFLCTTVFTFYFQYCLKNGRSNNIFQKITNIMVLLTILSLIMWICGSILDIIHTSGYVKVKWGFRSQYETYYYLHFNTQYEDGTFFKRGLINRNTGIFAEAPMYNLWLMISIFYELFLSSNINKKKIAILVLGVLTTMTSTGIILTLIMFGCKMLNTFQSKRQVPPYVYLIIIVAFFMLFNMIDNVIALKSDTASYASRYSDYIRAYDTFQRHPFTGTGFGENNYLTLGGSNTLMNATARGGVLLAILIIAPPLWLLIRGIMSRNNLYFSTSIFMLFLFATTIMTPNIVLLLLVAFNIALVFSSNRPNINTQSNNFKRSIHSHNIYTR